MAHVVLLALHGFRINRWEFIAAGVGSENLFRKATGDGREAVIAAIFWLKTRARWKETNVTELSFTRHEDALEQLK